MTYHRRYLPNWILSYVYWSWLVNEIRENPVVCFSLFEQVIQYSIRELPEYGSILYIFLIKCLFNLEFENIPGVVYKPQVYINPPKPKLNLLMGKTQYMASTVYTVNRYIFYGTWPNSTLYMAK